MQAILVYYPMKTPEILIKKQINAKKAQLIKEFERRDNLYLLNEKKKYLHALQNHHILLWIMVSTVFYFLEYLDRPDFLEYYTFKLMLLIEERLSRSEGYGKTSKYKY